MKATAEELAYLAGIVDGEGSVSLLVNGGICHVLVLSVANTSLIPLEMLQRVFGGAIYAHKRSPRIGGGLRKQLFHWRARNTVGAKALTAMLPFLRIKLPQARIALEYNASRLASITSPDQRRFGRRGIDTWNRHEDMRRALVELNGVNVYRRAEMREAKKYLAPRTPEEREAYVRARNVAGSMPVKAPPLH